MDKMQTALAATLLVAAATTAFAADLPTHKSPAAPPIMAPAFSWTGAYVGAFAGGNWAKVAPHDLTNPAFRGDPTLNSNGLTAGGLAGYNWAFNSFVLGGEMEGGYDHRGVSVGYLAGGAPRTASDYGAAEGRLRGRVGYAMGNFLLFGAGGVTASDLKLSYTNPLANAGAGFTQEINKWRVGYNVGGGLEWAFAYHWSVRGEYIFDDYQSPRYAFHQQNVNGFDSRSGKYDESTARAVLAYKF